MTDPGDPAPLADEGLEGELDADVEADLEADLEADEEEPLGLGPEPGPPSIEPGRSGAKLPLAWLPPGKHAVRHMALVAISSGMIACVSPRPPISAKTMIAPVPSRQAERISRPTMRLAIWWRVSSRVGARATKRPSRITITSSVMRSTSSSLCEM